MKYGKLFILFVITVVFLFPVLTTAADSLNVSVLDDLYTYWGTLTDIEVFDHYAYVVGDNSGLHIIDIADPENPEYVGFVYLWNIYQVKVFDHLAFVDNSTDLYEHLTIFDISDPTSPSLLSSIDYPRYTSLYYYAEGNDLFISAHFFGQDNDRSELQAYDITDPENPVLNSSYSIEDGRTGDFLIADEKVFLPTRGTDRNFYLKIVNIADTGNLQEISSTQLQAPADAFHYTRIVGDSSTIYFSANDDLWIVDVSDPLNVTPLGTISIEWDVCEIEKRGDYILSINNHQVRAFNVSDPANPTVDNFFSPEGIFGNYSIQGDLLYVLEGPYCIDEPMMFRVFVLNISNILDFQDVAIYDHEVYFSQMLKFENFIYLNSYYNSVHVVDVTDPSNLEHLDEFDIVTGDLFSGNENLISLSRDSLAIYDITNPAEPVLSYSSENTYNLDKIFIQENTMLGIGDYPHTGLFVFDISNPSDGPQLLSSFNSSSTYDDYFFPEKMAVQNGYIYLAGTFGDSEETSHLKVMHLEDNGDLEEFDNFGMINTNSYPRFIVATEDHLVAGDEDLYFYNIDDPENPFLESTYQTSRYLYAIGNQGNTLYYSYEDGFTLLNIVDVSNPVCTGFYTFNYGQTSFTYLQDNIMYAAGYHQLRSFDISDALDVDEEVPSSVIPAEFSILGAYPNPFNPTLNVSISLPGRGDLRLSVINVLGQEVALITDRSYNAGYHNFTFNGSELSSGIYFIRAKVDGKMDQVQKVVLMK